MSLLGTLLVVVVATTVAFRGTVRSSLTALVVTLVLVPDTLMLPGAGMTFLPVHRLVLLAFAAGLVRKAHRGELWRTDFRPTRVHAAFLLYAGVVFVTGIALSDPSLGVNAQLRVFAQILDQVVLFTGVLAACRSIDDHMWIGRLLAGLLVGVAMVAVFEKLSGWSYSQWMLSGPGQRLDALGRYPLEVRGGSTRVRSSAQFALAYGWLAAMLFPVLVWHAGRARRALGWRLALPVVALTVVWSGSRSALPALAVAFVMVVAGARFERPYVLLGVVAALAAVTLAAGVPSFARAYSSFEAERSDRTRTDRLADVTDVAADHPLTGVGLTGMKDRLGYYGADSSFLLAYVETGIVAVTLLVALLVTAVASATAALRAPPGPVRSLGAALLATVTLGVLGTGAYDLFSVPGSYSIVWIAAAVAVAIGERPVTPSTLHVRLSTIRERLALPVVAFGIGVLVLFGAEQHATVTFRFDALPLAREVYDNGVLDYAGRVLANTVCDRVTTAPHRVDIDVRCLVRDQTWGLGEIRVEGSSVEAAAVGAADLDGALRASFPTLQLVSEGAAERARPTLARTAPVWMTVIGIAVALLMPDPTRFRRAITPVRADPAPA
jgi:O-antigen ligase